MVIFRADGNPRIGTGHIMRCLSLADAFRERDVHSKFILAAPDMRPLIQGRGFECVVLGTAYDHMEEELPLFLPLLEENQPFCVVLDSYFVTPDYMLALRAKTPLVYIDDLNRFDYPADAVVNYNLYGKTTAYPPNKTYFLGPQYTPLRRQFQGIAPREPRKTVRQVLFSTGGTDSYHAALRCAEYLRDYSLDAVCHFVLGSMNRDAEQIEKLAAEEPRIVPHRQVTDMRALMLQCDAAVSAAGTTLYELCACGLPTVTYILADNQIDGAAAFEAAGLMPCAGDIRKDACFAERIFTKLEELGGQELREKTARRMQALVDGNGAARLAGEILERLGAASHGERGMYDE